nr:ribonuclease H-like domain-containing protein [Tanacetum cinerariifolium]
MDHGQPLTAQNETSPFIIPNPPENPNPVSVHPMVTRFRVGSNQPTQRLNLHVSSVSPVPKSYRDAFHHSNCRYKARLVANGSTQLEGVDVDGTFSLVVNPGFVIITSLHKEFAMTDLGSLNYFLVISGTRDSPGIFLSQKKYAIEILKRAHMVNCNPSRTPVATESKLGIDGDLVFDPTLYRSLAGSFQYLTVTRPNISYAVQQVCLHMHDLREPHFSTLKRILRYARGTMDYELQLFSSSTIDLVAYSDANWAGCPTARRSTSEAEYRDVANAVAETCWLRNLLRRLHTPLSSATLVYCDNVSDVYFSSNPIQHQRTKHIEIDIHFVCDLVAAGQVRVLHVLSRYQFAYIFTTRLSSTLFEEFRCSFSVRCSPAPTARES